MTSNSKLKADVLKEVGKVIYSDTQEIRVLLVRDPDKKVKISCQKWWRTSTKDEWNVGKGFFLDGRDAYELGELLKEIGGELIHVKNN